MSEHIDNIHRERNSKYGDWQTQSAVAQAIKDAYKLGSSYKDCSPAILEKLDMIANKLSRAVNGDPYYQDTWDDIAGYALLPHETTYSIDPNYKNTIHNNEVNYDNIISENNK